MRRILVALISAAVAVSGAVLTPVAVAAPDAAGTNARAVAAGIRWGACVDPDLVDAGAQCGFVTVPLNYAKPSGRKIKIAVSIVRHTVPDDQNQGVMLVNPGGPGEPGQYWAILGSYVPDGAGDAYDWIGFDPRGVGASLPALSCDPDYFEGPRPDYVPTTRTLAQTWLRLSKTYARACGRNGGALLDHLTTKDSARDMDSIRKALGADQINYYGFSYGTYLGQVYGTMFPSKVRRMVLDSNVDPRRVWYQANLDQDIAFERNMKAWFAWVAKYHAVYRLGRTEKAVERRWYHHQDLLRQKPAGGQVGADEWSDIFLDAGYYQVDWPDLGALFSTWVYEHKVRPLVQAYESAEGLGDDNGYAVYNAVQCTDTQWPKRWKKWRKDNWRTYKKAPYETWGNAWYNAPCLFWPAAAHQRVRVDGAKVTSALLIDETRDAATPYEGSLETRKRFPNSVLLAEPGGTSHAMSLFGNECVDGTVARYLATGELPKRKAGEHRADAFCDPLPVPVPTKKAAVTSLSSVDRRVLQAR